MGKVDRYRRLRAAVRRVERRSQQIVEYVGERRRGVRRRLMAEARIKALHEINGQC